MHRVPIQDGVIAAGGWDEVRFHKPVRPGDELWLEVTWTAKRRSESKRDRGIVTATMKLLNQDDEVVLSQKNTIFMRVRNLD
jgi:acyl dehydratase